MGKIQVKRIYEPVENTDGVRILVDRLWPRGIKKESVHLDAWMKDIAPSTELRKRFHQDPTKWEEFEADYRLELKENPAVKDLIAIVNKNKSVTFLYAVRDEQHNHAMILREFIQPFLKSQK
jgi:uncharacterized protein YeaO (DUF488 family)